MFAFIEIDENCIFEQTLQWRSTPCTLPFGEGKVSSLRKTVVKLAFFNSMVSTWHIP